MKQLLISLDVYKLESISKAIEDYKDVARITCGVNEGKAELTFEECMVDENRSVMEFENYLIGLENTR